MIYFKYMTLAPWKRAVLGCTCVCTVTVAVVLLVNAYLFDIVTWYLDSTKTGVFALVGMPLESAPAQILVKDVQEAELAIMKDIPRCQQVVGEVGLVSGERKLVFTLELYGGSFALPESMPFLHSLCGEHSLETYGVAPQKEDLPFVDTVDFSLLGEAVACTDEEQDFGECNHEDLMVKTRCGDVTQVELCHQIVGRSDSLGSAIRYTCTLAAPSGSDGLILEVFDRGWTIRSLNDQPRYAGSQPREDPILPEHVQKLRQAFFRTVWRRTEAGDLVLIAYSSRSAITCLWTVSESEAVGFTFGLDHDEEIPHDLTLSQFERIAHTQRASVVS